jgi:hypothetical protein
MDTVPPPPPLEEGAALPAEVGDALAKAEKERELAEAKAAEAEAEAQEAAAPAAGEGAKAAKADEPKVEAGEIDQETYDALIAEGKSERIARSKAKAAYVKKQKAKLREQAAAAPVEAEPAAKPKEAEVHVEAGQIDQETYDALIAEGKPERMARAKAKAAYVKKEKARLRAEAAADAPAADAPAADAPAEDTPAAEAPAEEAPAEAPKQKLADVHVEGAGEIDQETYDRLIAEGKSERIARSKAKAAWVKKKKQEQLDAGGDG